MSSFAIVCSGSMELAELVKFLFQFSIFENFHIYSSSDAILEVVQSLNSRLIFLDMNMPKMNGFELMERIVRIRPDILFVIVADSECYALEALQLGAIDYLLKPVTMERFSLLEKKLSKMLLD